MLSSSHPCPCCSLGNGTRSAPPFLNQAQLPLPTGRCGTLQPQLGSLSSHSARFRHSSLNVWPRLALLPSSQPLPAGCAQQRSSELWSKGSRAAAQSGASKPRPACASFTHCRAAGNRHGSNWVLNVPDLRRLWTAPPTEPHRAELAVQHPQHGLSIGPQSPGGLHKSQYPAPAPEALRLSFLPCPNGQGWVS